MTHATWGFFHGGQVEVEGDHALSHEIQRVADKAVRPQSFSLGGAAMTVVLRPGPK